MRNWLGCNVRKWSRFAGWAPLETRYLLRNAAWLSSSSMLSAMYCGMSLSRFDNAAMYAGLPPFTPPSSLCCSHRSLSISSAAARKRRTATSPAVSSPARRFALAAPATSALAGSAAAPATPRD
jgi:hypothetical protein